MLFKASIRSLLGELRLWPELLRRRLSFYWRYGEKDHLVFPLLLTILVLAIGAIIVIA
jgi:hypothetical protein